MRFEAEPHALLRPYVRSYWGMERVLPPPGRFTITPDRYIELLFFVEPPFDESAGVPLALCTLVPLLDAPLTIRIDGRVRCASVRLHAWAAGMLVAHADLAAASPARAWADVSASFADIEPIVRDALRREAWPEIVACFDGALLQRLRATPDPQALAAVRAFLATPDGVLQRTDDVAQHLGRSRRQIERRVRSLTERSPKQLAALVRFQYVRDALWAQPETQLERVALDAGYADQAHLTRDFRRYAGQTPAAFARACRALRAQSPDDDVAFVQDAGRLDVDDEVV